MRLTCFVRAAVAAVVLAAPAAASAATIEQIVALSKAGVSDAVILALIDRDRTILTIEPEQVVALKRDGLSDAVIMAMLKSGREEGDEAARAISSATAASILSSLSTAPDLTIVGHGPDRPNTAHTEEFYLGLRDGVRLPAAVPLGSPYPFPYAKGFGLPHARRGLGRRTYRDPIPMLCVAQVNTPSGRGPSYLTECPAAMQLRVR